MASSNNCFNFDSDCPYILLKISQPLISTIYLFNEYVIVFANNVFPVPEIPYKRIPQTSKKKKKKCP